jgi:hypothetical protein
MKEISLLFISLSTSIFSIAQYNTQWYYPSTLNTTPAGYIGIGTKNNLGTANTPLPAFNLHLHGTADFITNDDLSGMKPIDIINQEEDSPNLKVLMNYGKTARLGLTNSITGLTQSDGAVFQMSESNLSIKNQESGSITLSAPNIALTLSSATKRIWVGGTQTTAVDFARFNVYTSDNGMFIQTVGTAKYGLRIRSKVGTDAVQVYNEAGTTKNFKVTSDGMVFARKYTTTLNAIPDYVFSPTYVLMPLDELKSFLEINRHLPNVPSAKEYEEKGVDLGEMNRVLLEKVEELTLYIIQLEGRMKIIENSEK